MNDDSVLVPEPPDEVFENSTPVTVERTTEAPPESVPPQRIVAPPVRSATRTLPHSAEAEEAILSACFLDGQDVIPRCREAGITPASFYDANRGIIYRVQCALFDAKKPTETFIVAEELKAEKLLDLVGGIAFLAQVSARIPTTAQVPYFIDKVKEQALLRETIRAATLAVENAYNFSGGIAEFTQAIQTQIAAIAERSGTTKSLKQLCLAREFNPLTATEEPKPRFLINDRAVSTPGNLTNIIAQSKSGKSAYIGAMMSATVAADAGISDCDTLGVTSTKPGKSILLHIDTEQSIYDHHQLIQTALRRAGVETKPEWLKSFALAGFTPDELRTVFLLLIELYAPFGLFAIILDGGADMVKDVNDPGECNPFVAQLHGLAITHNCPIISVVHENPGQDYGKMRGHFGSQLERKAESNLRLKKSDEITVVFSEKMRKAPILEKDGPRFSWDNEKKMHLSCESVGKSRDTAKREHLFDKAEAIFQAAGKPSLSWSEFAEGIAKLEDISKSGATKRFEAFKSLNVVKKDLIGRWTLVRL